MRTRSDELVPLATMSSPSRNIALSIVVALLAAMFAMVSAPQAATAAGNQDGVSGYTGNVIYAYVKAGESLTATGDTGRIGTVVEPDGTTHTGAATYGPASQDGVWSVELISAGTNVGYDWSVNAETADGSVIPGRAWAAIDRIRQPGAANFADLDYWIVNNTGYVYSIELDGYNGINSFIQANSVGWADGDCAPTYASYEYDATDVGSNAPPLPDCGEAFRVFYEQPAADLPATAMSAQGEVTIIPSVLGTSDMVIDDLVFTPATTGTAAGTFTYSINPRFTGGYLLQVDADGNGSYEDDVDRSIRLGADGSGSYVHEFDGLDGNGAAIEDCTTMNARVYFDKLGETHIIQTDVEAREGGISITRLNGAGSPDSRIHWNDEGMAGGRATSTDPLVGAGVDSSAGVHGWGYHVNGWGNGRYIDDWAYLPADFGTGEITIGGRCLSVEKTSNATDATRVGDTVEYTVTATNTGDTDYTLDEPAIVFDNLSGVLDDAEYNDDATATLGDVPSFLAPSHLRWSGALAAGESVELSYSVTLTAGGDGNVRNVAWAPLVPPPGEEVPPTTPTCEPRDADGRDLATGEPCGPVVYELPRLSIQKSADTTELPSDGGVVTYTVTVTNEGPGATTVDDDSVVDDLSEVLDDGEFVDGSESATIGTVTVDTNDAMLSWNGALSAGESAVVTYQVTYDATATDGDQSLLNVVCLPVNLAQDPENACRQVVIPGAGLDQWKSSDPDSGTSVTAGDTVTYSLHFANSGQTAATVDTFDDLSDVLDDADLVAGSLQAESGLVATFDTDRITVTGSVPVGETLTVSYQVQVRERAAQDNHILGNVLDCADGDPRCETEHPIRNLLVEKSADPVDGVDVGDTVTYAVTVTNNGEADYTAQVPASITDDLSDVLDDAEYNGDASVEFSGDSSSDSPTVAGESLVWSGPLQVGEVATITYSVTITSSGDHDLVNVVCETGTDNCDSVGILLPHVDFAKSSDPASGADVQAGQVVTYTLTFVNDGQAAGVVDSVDDLTEIIDDADITGVPVSSDPAVTATLLSDSIRIVGDIDAGQTITVTYQATVKPDGERGDNRLENVLIPDNPAVPPVPPVVHPVGELDDWKTVDPASGTTVRPGQVMTYTLHFENIGKALVAVDREDVLTQILDDAAVTSLPVSSDAALTVTEIDGERFGISGSLEPGQLVTVTYQVTVNADGDRGDDRLGNFLVNAGEEPATDCVPADDERPDCTVNHVSNVVVTKSADPSSGTKVAQGEKVTYTLTFRNVSANADAEDVAVDYTDHMADVLDDATLTGTPISSDAAVTATAVSDTIRVVGAVASGETVTVTYAVTVKAYTDQGDHHLGNVVAIAGEDPICAPDSMLCTNHEVEEPDPLATTGGDIAWPAVWAALLLLIGGGTLLMIRKRRETATLAGDELS
ncbi:MAG: hypothetical protein Q8Q19_00785 [Microbacterium sp.]|nr:hypothetical protein [Microbacterium sp.]